MRASSTLSNRLEYWLVWMVVTAIGWLVSLFLASIIAQALSSLLPGVISLLIGGAVGGALLGLVQWMFLHPAVRRIDLWALASALGWIVGLAVAALTISVISWPLAAIIGGAVGGLLCGLAQSSALHVGVRGGAGWILTTLAGWTLALIVGTALRGSAGPDSMQVAIMDIAGSWTTGGVIIGLILIVILVTVFPRSEEKDARSPVDWWP